MQDSLKSLILKLFDIGAIEFGKFKFKHHDIYPDAPLAPIKINLRTPDHPNPGKLTPEIVNQIAFLFLEIIKREKIHFDYIAGIPRAGEPFAQVLAKILGKPLITAEKIEEGDKRKIGKITSSQEIIPGQSVLLFDDVITKGLSKDEMILRCEERGLEIAAIILLVDREEGGMKTYEKLSYRLITATTITKVVDLGLAEKRISQQKYRECLDYLELSRANKEGTGNAILD